MATKITITADTKEASENISSLAGEVENLGTAAVEAAEQASSLGGIGEQVAEQSQGAADGVKALGDAASAAGSAAKIAGLSFGWVGVLITTITQVVSWFKKAESAVRAVGDVGKAAFGDANQSAKALNVEIAKVDALLKDVYRSFQDYQEAQRAAADAAEELARSYLERPGSKAAKELLEQANLEERIASQKAAFGAATERENARLLAEDTRQKIAKINNAKELEDMAQREWQNTKLLADAGKLNAEQLKEYALLIRDIHERQEQIYRDDAEAVKKAEKEKTEAKKEAAEEAERLDMEAFEYGLQVAEEDFNRKNALIQEQVRKEAEAAERRAEIKRKEQEEERKRHQKGLEDAGVVKEIERQVNDPDRLAKTLAHTRGEEAREAAHTAGANERDAAIAAAKARQQAYRNAKRQAAGGREEFSREEIEAARHENTQETMDALRKSGRLSHETLSALQMSINESRQQSQEMTALQDAIKELQRQAQNVAQDGQRRRSQRNSNRQ